MQLVPATAAPLESCNPTLLLGMKKADRLVIFPILGEKLNAGVDRDSYEYTRRAWFRSTDHQPSPTEISESFIRCLIISH